MEEEEYTFFNENGENTNSDSYQRHSKKSKRSRSNPKRDDQRYGQSTSMRKKTHNRKKERGRRGWD